MAETEGVIKFDLAFRETTLEDNDTLDELLEWRDVFYRLGAIGQDPNRYQGYAFGNISHRLGDSDSFIISGTQTGAYPSARKSHFTCVDQCDLGTNRVSAHGPIRPSSESLTHAAIYELDVTIRCVVHGHLPELWSRTRELNIAFTPESIEYGTPEMAEAISRLYRETGKPQQAVFCMLGHEDGIIAYGTNFGAIENSLRSLIEA